jgi:hypothetical protein
MSSISSSIRSPSSWRISRPAEAMACTNEVVEVHCDPTWKVSPYGRSPRSRAMCISARASWNSAPNLRDSGNTLLLSSTRTRT